MRPVAPFGATRLSPPSLRTERGGEVADRNSQSAGQKVAVTWEEKFLLLSTSGLFHELKLSNDPGTLHTEPVSKHKVQTLELTAHFPMLGRCIWL